MMEKRLESLDLNLLLVLHWLLAERNVTAAATQLGLSQPAASRALGRLREVFGDPLLVKAGGEMAPTPLAESIQPQLAHAIDRCRDVLRVTREFLPAEQTGAFRMACSDYLGVLAAAIWQAVIHPEAPHLTLDIQTPTLETARELVSGRVDLCVIPDSVTLDLPPTIDKDAFVQRPIFEQDFICAVGKSHPLAGQKITLEDYLALDHVLITPEGKSRGLVDDALARIGRERRIRFRVPSFLMGVPLVKNTNCVMTAPRPLIAMRAEELYTFPPPVDLPTNTMFAIWHPNWTHDARHKWVRERFFSAIPRVSGCPFTNPDPLRAPFC